MKKGIHKRGVLKGSEGNLSKNAPTKNETCFREEETFLHTKRFQLKIKTEKNISCFFKKKKKGCERTHNKT